MTTEKIAGLTASEMGAERETVRTFGTGANRNSDEGKLDFEGFLSPLVLERYAEYMQEHRALEDGTIRDSDNWQKGMPLAEYMKSAWRHFFTWWKRHREWGVVGDKEFEDTICALIFNANGYLHEYLKAQKASDGGGRPVVVPPRETPPESSIMAEVDRAIEKILEAAPLRYWTSHDLANNIFVNYNIGVSVCSRTITKYYLVKLKENPKTYAFRAYDPQRNRNAGRWRHPLAPELEASEQGTGRGNKDAG